MAQPIPDVVDIIVAGGGAAGCVVAARVAVAHPTLSILLIEAGPTNLNHPQVIHPALFGTHLAPDAPMTKFYKSLPGKEISGREVAVATGHVLGGGSSINFQAYVRPSRSDFDDWGIEGWGSEECVRLMKKFETFHIPAASETEESVHGFEGEFHVSQGGIYPQQEPVGDFLRAATCLGYGLTADPQNLKSANAFGPMAAWINPKTGHRSDAAHTLIHPLLDSQTTKLQVICEHEVIRVLFNSAKHATGVEIQGADSKRLTISARKLVVLSAGAFGSPMILERSGVGRQDILSRINAPTIYNNPSVGANYQDHPLCLWPYSSSAAPGTTMDCFMSGRLSIEEALSNGSNILGSNHIEGTGKIRPSEEDLKTCSKGFNELWNRDFKDRTDKPLCALMLPNGYLGDPSSVPVGQYFTIATMPTYPYSRGYVHASGPGIEDAPDLEAGLLQKKMDLEVMVWAYKKQREVARHMDCYRGPVSHGHPIFADGSNASYAISDRDVDKIPKEQIKMVEYAKEDDQAIVDFIKSAVGPTWHSLGTCSMKTEETGGVVDGSLNVYGVHGLKVADLSVIPEMVGANTYSTALLVGEKAAEIILEELKE